MFRVKRSSRIESSKDYLAWIDSLSDGDAVVFQEFRVVDVKYLPQKEIKWSFELGELSMNKGVFSPRFGSDTKPITAEGVESTWNNRSQSSLREGRVFLDRIVPLTPGLELELDSSNSYKCRSENPLYEPLWYNGYKYTFKSSGTAKEVRAISRVMPNLYTEKILGGELIICFSMLEPSEIEDLGLSPLYAQEMG